MSFVKLSEVSLQREQLFLFMEHATLTWSNIDHGRNSKKTKAIHFIKMKASKINERIVLRKKKKAQGKDSKMKIEFGKSEANNSRCGLEICG